MDDRPGSKVEFVPAKSMGARNIWPKYKAPSMGIEGAFSGNVLLSSFPF